MWDEAQHELEQVRLFGDLAVAAFFAGAKPKAREAKRLEFADAVTNGDRRAATGRGSRSCAHAEPPLVPFHWEIEFPEVFDRDNAGVRRDRRQPAVRWQEHDSPSANAELLRRLARGRAPGEPRQRRPGRALLPARVRPAARATARSG